MVGDLCNLHVCIFLYFIHALIDSCFQHHLIVAIVNHWIMLWKSFSPPRKNIALHQHIFT